MINCGNHNYSSLCASVHLLFMFKNLLYDSTVEVAKIGLMSD